MFEDELKNNGNDTIVGYDDENNYLVYFNDTKRTYKVSKDGTITPLENAPELVTETIYVTLYSDGLMAFSNNSETDNTKTVTKIYTIGKNDSFNQDSIPWKNECNSIKKVDFVNEIIPTNMNCWFNGCGNLLEIDNIENLNTNRSTGMWRLFWNCANLTNIDVSNFNTSRVTIMNSMFCGCSKLKNIDVSNFDTKNVAAMVYMFANCSSLTSLDLSNFDTSHVTSMQCMFQNYQSLISLDVSHFNTSNVTNMMNLFQCCNKIKVLDLSNWDTNKVQNMNHMFSAWNGNSNTDMALEEIIFSNKFDTTNVTSMHSMFYGLNNLVELDLSSFNTSKVTNMYHMINSCSKLTTIYTSNNFVTTAVINSEDMFYLSAKLVGGNGTTYNSSKTDKTYARIDGGLSSSTPGYFTYKSNT